MSDGVRLPFAVERLIEEICVQKLLPLPDVAARKCLSKIDEESAIDVLKRISLTSKRIYNLNGYIMYMANKYGSSLHIQYAESIHGYPSSPPPSSSISSTPTTSTTFITFSHFYFFISYK